jgi:hypothetical protein
VASVVSRLLVFSVYSAPKPKSLCNCSPPSITTFLFGVWTTPLFDLVIVNSIMLGALKFKCIVEAFFTH